MSSTSVAVQGRLGNDSGDSNIPAGGLHPFSQQPTQASLQLSGNPESGTAAAVPNSSAASDDLSGALPGLSPAPMQAAGMTLAMPSKPAFLPEEDDYDADD